MTTFYSAESGGFYKSELHGDAIPDDAVELSDKRYAELLTGQSSGGRIKAGSNGDPWVEFYEPTEAAQRLSAKVAIDKAAGKARSRFVSPGDLVDQEYLSAENQADQFKTAGYPSDAVPSEVQAWADATGMTPQSAADDIISTGQSWRTVLASIRAIRLAGKAAVDASIEADIESTAATYIAQLDAVVPS